jgi:SAM-dependent methyltransferase
MRHPRFLRIRSFALLAVALFLTSLIGADDTPTPHSDEVAPAVEQSIEDPEGQPFLGIELGSSTDGGTTVGRVIPDTAAVRFGLEAGDVILRIDHTQTDSPLRVREAIGSLRPGDVVEIELLRSGEPRTIRLELGRRPDELVLRRDRADQVLEVLQIRPGLDVADIGCGSGWLSEAIAIELEGSGTVYAVELQEDHIESLRRRALPGVVPVLSESDDVSLPENSLDIAMLHDVASHIDTSARKRFYESVSRALRPGGRLVIFGPHGEGETMLDVLRDNGFVPVDHDLDGLTPDDLDQRLSEGIVFRPAPAAARQTQAEQQ